MLLLHGDSSCWTSAILLKHKNVPRAAHYWQCLPENTVTVLEPVRHVMRANLPKTPANLQVTCHSTANPKYQHILADLNRIQYSIYA